MKSLRLLGLLYCEYCTLVSWHEQHKLDLISIFGMLVFFVWILLTKEPPGGLAKPEEE